jgi:hypothetical protein
MLGNYSNSPDVLKQVENTKKKASGKKVAEEWVQLLYLREDDYPFSRPSVDGANIPKL